MPALTKEEDLHKKRLEFMLLTLESVEKRRVAVENKTSILLAANAIILTGILSLGFPKINTIDSTLDLIQVILMGATLGCIFLSILYCSGVLGGLTNDKLRGRIMDIKNEHNVFYFGKIAERDKNEYLAEIEKLTEKQIFEQIGADVHNVSRIVRDRYGSFNRANRFFIISVISFLGVAIAQFINL
jgi:hypothetical protein